MSIKSYVNKNRTQAQAWLRRHTTESLGFRAGILGISHAYGVWEANIEVDGTLTHVKVTFGDTEVDAWDLAVGEADPAPVEPGHWVRNTRTDEVVFLVAVEHGRSTVKHVDGSQTFAGTPDLVAITEDEELAAAVALSVATGHLVDAAAWVAQELAADAQDIQPSEVERHDLLATLRDLNQSYLAGSIAKDEWEQGSATLRTAIDADRATEDDDITFPGEATDEDIKRALATGSLVDAGERVLVRPYYDAEADRASVCAEALTNLRADERAVLAELGVDLTPAPIPHTNDTYNRADALELIELALSETGWRKSASATALWLLSEAIATGYATSLGIEVRPAGNDYRVELPA
jgi:hypothetical protein